MSWRGCHSHGGLTTDETGAGAAFPNPAATAHGLCTRRGFHPSREASEIGDATLWWLEGAQEEMGLRPVLGGGCGRHSPSERARAAD